MSSWLKWRVMVGLSFHTSESSKTLLSSSHPLWTKGLWSNRGQKKKIKPNFKILTHGNETSKSSRGLLGNQCQLPDYGHLEQPFPSLQYSLSEEMVGNAKFQLVKQGHLGLKGLSGWCSEEFAFIHLGFCHVKMEALWLRLERQLHG